MSQVALVHNINRGGSEREVEFDSPQTIGMLHGIISEQHDCTLVEATQDMSWISLLARDRPDVVFNVAEGFHGPAREALYPAIFDQLGIRYCGPDATNLALTLNKSLTKHLAVGVPDLEIPHSHLWSDRFDPRALRAGRHILKLVHEGSSIGMRLARSPEEASDMARSMAAAYGDLVMIEEFVPGTDVSMAFVEGIGTLGPAAVVLPRSTDEFYDFDLKSTRDTEVSISALDLPAHLKSRLHLATSGLVRRLDLRGYAKIDFRLGEDGVLHLIEVNGQVSFHSEGEFANCCRAGGYELDDVIHSIITTGLTTKRMPSAGVLL